MLDKGIDWFFLRDLPPQSQDPAYQTSDLKVRSMRSPESEVLWWNE
jgi:hypothetical protein